MDAVGLIAVLVGATACFFGYRLITDAIRVWGFIILGAFATLIAVNFLGVPGSLTQPSVAMIIIFVAAGIVGALIAGPLSVVIIFISGTALGVAIGEAGLPLFIKENMLITVILGLVTGLMAVGFQEITLIVTTSFVGGLLIAFGANRLAAIEILPLVIICFVLGFFGAAAQYKTEHPDSSLMGR